VVRENRLGDLVLTDPAVIRVVAEPTRYALLMHLQRKGGATAEELARRLELSTPDVEPHLRVLARHGLVRQTADPSGQGSGTWEALGRGLLVELPAEPEGQQAARLLTSRRFLEAAAMPQRGGRRTSHGWRPAGGRRPA
jgi:DNA-binding transcriptional ArsR family regulator